MEEAGLQGTAIGKPLRKSKRPLTWLIIAVVIIILIFFAVKFMGSKTQKSASSNITPTPTQFQTPTDTPTPSISTSPTPTQKPTNTPTPTAKPTANPVDRTTGLDRSKLSLTVQNGSGVVGAAGKAADFLKSLGYNVTSTGNADNYNYTNVTIQVRSARGDYLPLLKTDLSTNYTVGAASSDLSASSSADALVIIGK